MVRMLSGVVNSAKTASRRVWCGALSLGTLPGPRRHGLGYPAQAGLPGAGSVRCATWCGLGAPVRAGQQFGGRPVPGHGTACGTGFLYFVR